MKKFLMYVIIVVVALFVCFASYYFLRNNETITCTISSDKSLYINVDDTFDLPIIWTKKNKYTTLDISIPKINNEDILEYDSNNQVFTAKSAGLVTVTISPSNTNFGPFKFNVFIGNGSKDYPFYIKSAQELNRIGRDELATSVAKKFDINKSYQLIADIDLSEINEWKPIGSATLPYNGTFNGNGYSIFNMKITANHDNAGFFAVVGSDAVVENIKFQDAEIETSSSNVGIVAGTNNGFIGKIAIKNAVISNALVESNNGAIVGTNSYSNDTKNRATVQMCYADVAFTTSGYTGGLVGKNVCSTIYDSYVTINSYNSKEGYLAFGGMVGFDESKSYLKNVVKKNTITNSFETVQQNGYTSSVIKNCYVIFANALLTTQDRCANFIGKFADENLDRKTSYYINNYYTFPEAENSVSVNYAIANGYNANGTMNSENMISYIIKGNMKNKDNFKGWFNGDVWVLEENQTSPTLNFDAMYAKLSVFDESVPIASKEYVKEMLQIIAQNPSLEQTYLIDATTDSELDLEGMEFTTIAKNSSMPMKANILVADNKTFTIKNFKLKGDNHSFFGFISNATIQGLRFENVTIEHGSNVAGTAVIATDLYSGAMLEDCSVENVNITTNAINIGLISAKNTSGTIDNCNVTFGLNVSSIYLQNSVAKCGGIVGQNTATVKNCEVEGLRIILGAKESGFVDVGCAIGTSTTSISNIYVYGSVAIVDESNASGYVAGLVAQTEANITSCFSLAQITAKEANSGLYVGGIAGLLGYNGTLTRSFYGNAGEENTEGSALLGNWVAGLVCDNYGAITESYTRATITGNRVGGLSVMCYGRLENCGVYDGTQLNGTNKKTAKVSGISSIIRKGGVVRHCYSSATFGGEVMVLQFLDAWFAESESEVRLGPWTRMWANLIPSENKEEFTWDNIAVINYGGAIIKCSTFSFDRRGFTDLSPNQCKGEDNYAAIIGMGFEGDSSASSRTPWVFPEFEKDTYMYLRNVVKNPQLVTSETEAE